MLHISMNRSPSGGAGSQIYEERYTDGNVSTRYWHGSSRGTEHRVQNVLPVQQRLLWPAAKHAYLPRLLGASRGTASTKRQGHRGLYHDRARPRLRNSDVLAVRQKALLLSRFAQGLSNQPIPAPFCPRGLYRAQ